MTDPKTAPATDEEIADTFSRALIARIDADRAQIKRCHAIIQGLVSLAEVTDDADIQVYKDAEKELSGEFCSGACTTSCDADRDADRAENAKLRARVAELEAVLKAAIDHCDCLDYNGKALIPCTESNPCAGCYMVAQIRAALNPEPASR